MLSQPSWGRHHLDGIYPLVLLSMDRIGVSLRGLDPGNKVGVAGLCIHTNGLLVLALLWLGALSWWNKTFCISKPGLSRYILALNFFSGWIYISESIVTPLGIQGFHLCIQIWLWYIILKGKVLRTYCQSSINSPCLVMAVVHLCLRSSIPLR